MGGLGLWLLACAAEPERVEPVAVPMALPETPPGPWRITGRARTGQLLVPAMEMPECSLLAERLKARPAAECGMERWSNGPETRVMAWVGEVGGEAPSEEGPFRRVEAHWTSLGSVLRPCMFDLWTLPPAGDLRGERHLEKDAWNWHLSGRNPCRLEGDFRLLLHADRVEVGSLSVDGSAWDSGGRKNAQGRLWIALREVLLRDWKTFTPSEQAEIREALSAQPGEEAKSLLRQLDRPKKR